MASNLTDETGAVPGLFAPGSTFGDGVLLGPSSLGSPSFGNDFAGITTGLFVPPTVSAGLKLARPVNLADKVPFLTSASPSVMFFVKQNAGKVLAGVGVLVAVAVAVKLARR